MNDTNTDLTHHISPQTLALRMAEALHGHGTPAPELEDMLADYSADLGIEAQFLSTPTALFASFGPTHVQRTAWLRVTPGDPDLEKLSEIHALCMARDKRNSARDELLKLESILRAPPRYGPVSMSAAAALTSGSAACFFGGGWTEIAVAMGLGIIVANLAILCSRWRGAAPLTELTVSVASAALAASLHRLGLAMQVQIAVLGALIIWIPGLTLTVAVRELATRHLASGTARLMAALIVFLTLAFGVSLGFRITGGPPSILESPTHPVAPFMQLICLAVAPLSFGVLLRAHPRDFPAITIATITAFAGSRLGAHFLGPELGVGCGTFCLGLMSRLHSKFFERPAAVIQVPALLLLVPGSLGFRSLSALLQSDVISGLERASTMLSVAVSLVFGLLFSHWLTLPRQTMQHDDEKRRVAARQRVLAKPASPLPDSPRELDIRVHPPFSLQQNESVEFAGEVE